MTQAHQTVRDVRRSMRAAVHSYPEAKEKAKQATNSDNWGPTFEQKQELVTICCNQREDRELVFRALWKRAHDDSDYWMHVYKALDVFEHLLIMDVPEIRASLAQHDRRLSDLLTYDKAEHNDPVRRSSLNDNVRAKAKRITTLLDDASLLETERQRILLIQQKMSGQSVSSANAAASAPRSESPATRTQTSGQHDVYASLTPVRSSPPSPASRSVSPAPVTSAVPSPDAKSTVASPVPGDRPVTLASGGTQVFSSDRARQPDLFAGLSAPPTTTVQPARSSAAPAAAPPTFDPFADLDASRGEIQHPPQHGAAPAPAAGGFDDFFGASSEAAPAVHRTPAAGVEAARPEPRRASGSVSPARGGDAFAELLNSQLDAYATSSQRRRSENTESLEDIMRRRRGQ